MPPTIICCFQGLATPIIEIQDDDDEVEPAEEELVLCKPTGKSSPWWKEYDAYNLNVHPDRKDWARCKVPGCGANIKCNHGTGGLKKHLQYKHPDRFEAILATIAPPVSRSRFGNITKHFGRKKKEKTVAELKEEVSQAVASWVIDTGSVALRSVESQSFRQMFYPLNAKAPEIVQIGRHKCREEVTKLGMVARNATCREIVQIIACLTTDHWTSPADDTWSCITGHYIENWVLRSLIVDFKVWHGRTTGDILADDMAAVVKKHCMLAQFLIAITDTTGNMVTLGRYLRKNYDTEHAFCVDHNIQRNAILAFNGEPVLLFSSQVVTSILL